ncbi:hypothetical protein NMY22_g10242 [Coprinellus aureogranulatus]|nr:hypothetical protein NMY22_g10242 [Coprinellus aureogranulatus]
MLSNNANSQASAPLISPTLQLTDHVNVSSYPALPCPNPVVQRCRGSEERGVNAPMLGDISFIPTDRFHSFVRTLDSSSWVNIGEDLHGLLIVAPLRLRLVQARSNTTKQRGCSISTILSMASLGFQKHWKRDGSKGTIDVVPDEFKDYHKRPPGAIKDVLMAYGFAGLVACPDVLPSGKPAPPSSQGGIPLITEIVRIPEVNGELDSLWTLPEEFLTQDIPLEDSAFKIPMNCIHGAPGWGEDQMTAGHMPIYNACICGLAEMVEMSAKAELRPRMGDGRESDIRFVLFEVSDNDYVRKATFSSEHKRPDSAFQGTFDKEPWVLPEGATVSYVSAWTAISQGIMSQVESYTHYDMNPNGSIAFATFAVPPGRLHVLGFNHIGLLCAMSGNVIPPCGQGDGVDILTNPKCWEEYYSRVLWICFIWLVGCSNEFASKWENDFGEQGASVVAKARRINSLIGEACKASPARQWALSLIRLKHLLLRTMGYLSSAVLPVRLLLKTIQQLHDESLHETITFDNRSMFSLGSLWLSGAKIFANENTTVYIYEDPGIVVKVFQRSAKESFARELAAYEVCGELQGEAIPWLYGSGRRRSDGKRVLVTSYAGSPVERLTPEIIDKVWAGPLRTLNRKMHHHDIWEGNIVENREGQLMLVDLGSAVPNEDCVDASKCPDKCVYDRLKFPVGSVGAR